MFDVSLADVNALLPDFGIHEAAISLKELQRYCYEENDPDSKEVRLILRADFASGAAVVIRFKNESDVSLELIEQQSKFAALLRSGGILSPAQYRSGNAYARWYGIHGYDVIVTVEEFVEGELTSVDASAAEKTGRILAQMHSIAEENAFHVENAVLFDPFAHNDLFELEDFRELEGELEGENLELFHKILECSDGHMRALSPLRDQPRYAVQGDISDCNLYMTAEGELGVFDFNRCGDNNLFCDAVMQAVFEARLMDYPEHYGEEREAIILQAFLKGYQSVRPFTQAQKEWYLHLYALIDAFWSADIKWNDDSLMNAVQRKDAAEIGRHLKNIYRKCAAKAE